MVCLWRCVRKRLSFESRDWPPSVARHQPTTYLGTGHGKRNILFSLALARITHLLWVSFISLAPTSIRLSLSRLSYLFLCWCLQEKKNIIIHNPFKALLPYSPSGGGVPSSSSKVGITQKIVLYMMRKRHLFLRYMLVKMNILNLYHQETSTVGHLYTSSQTVLFKLHFDLFS